MRSEAGGKISQNFGISSCPSALLLDANGVKIADVGRDVFSAEDLASFIDKWAEFPALEKEKETKKNDFEWNVKYGALMSAAGKFDVADNCFAVSLSQIEGKDNKLVAGFYYEYAAHAIAKKEIAEGEKRIGKVMGLDNGNAFGYYAKAAKLYNRIIESLAAERKTDKIPAYLEKIIAADNEGKYDLRDEALIGKASMLAMDKKTAESLKILEELAANGKKIKTRASALVIAGRVYAMDRQYVKALEKFEEASAKYPDTPEGEVAANFARQAKPLAEREKAEKAGKK